MTKSTKYGRTAITAVAGMSMVMTIAAAPALAADASESEAPGNDTAAVKADSVVESAQVLEDTVEGTFSYDQATTTPNSIIKMFFNKVAQTICGATANLAIENPLDWRLEVTGDVENAFIASVDDLAKDEATNQLMTCTCGGNPAGGRAIITADVTGIPLESLLTRAGLVEGANTITFISADGTEVAMPLAYAIGRHAVISYEINDEDLSASVGGNNQLWMMKTPANYFVRDIIKIVVTDEDEIPAAPGTTDVHPNSPNAGILAGSQA